MFYSDYIIGLQNYEDTRHTEIFPSISPEDTKEMTLEGLERHKISWFGICS